MILKSGGWNSISDLPIHIKERINRTVIDFIEDNIEEIVLNNVSSVIDVIIEHGLMDFYDYAKEKKVGDDLEWDF